MKTNSLIIIGTVIAIIISVSALIIIDNIEAQSKNSPLTDTLVCPKSTSEIPHEDAVWNLDSCYWFVDDPYIPYELQQVLDICFKSWGMYHDSKSYQNGTHYIDTAYCEWKLIENTPNKSHTGLGLLHAIAVADKEKLQKVLDYCEEKRQAEASNWIRPDGTDWAMITIPLEWHNSTHSINNIDCKWNTPSRGNIP